MNLKIREFKVTIENYTNEVDLPPEVKRIVLKQIYEGVEREANLVISKELKDREEAAQEDKQDE